jgi:hypothetical protein
MVEIEIVGGQTAFDPGDVIPVRLSWLLDSAPTKLEVRLAWHTQGKGDRDSRVVEVVELSDVSLENTIDLSITLPSGPYSFSGQLISLVWSLEAIAHPDDSTSQCELIMAPGKREVQLARVESE